MSDERGDAAGYMGWFLFGAALGAAAALLLTPKTGAQARELLFERGGDVAKRAQDFANHAQGHAGEWLDKIREHQYRGQKLLLETNLAEPSSLKGAERAKFETLAAKFAEEEKRYNAEKKDIEKDAKKLEQVRDRHRDRHPYFEFGEVFLQVAIVSASVSILSSSRPMFWFSLILALLGTVLALNGFVPLFTLPLLHHH